MKRGYPSSQQRNAGIPMSLSLNLLHKQADIVSAEPETVIEGIIDLSFTRFIGNVIEIAIGIGFFVIDCGW